MNVIENAQSALDIITRKYVEARERDGLRTSEVADVLGVSEATIKRWADQKRIHCRTTESGRRFFALQDIVDFSLSNQPAETEQDKQDAPRAIA